MSNSINTLERSSHEQTSLTGKRLTLGRLLAIPANYHPEKKRTTPHNTSENDASTLPKKNELPRTHRPGGTDDLERFGKTRIDAYGQHARAKAPGAIGARIELRPPPTRLPAYDRSKTNTRPLPQDNNLPIKAASSSERTPSQDHQNNNPKGKGKEKAKGKSQKQLLARTPILWRCKPANGFIFKRIQPQRKRKGNGRRPDEDETERRRNEAGAEELAHRTWGRKKRGMVAITVLLNQKHRNINANTPLITKAILSQEQHQNATTFQ